MINVQELIKIAWNKKTIVPNMSVPHLPMIDPLIKAAIDQRIHLILSVARVEWMKFGSQSMAAVKEEFERCKPPSFVHLHLDHIPVIDEDFKQIDYLSILKEGISLGYESIMVDGSRLSLEKNIENTKAAVKLAVAAGIPCEAELGAVLGHENGPLPPYDELFNSGKGFTITDEAVRFVTETGCNWLSVAIGNVHGAVAEATKNQRKIEARLNLKHLDKLHESLDVPLVLHGGSGIRVDDLRKSITKGIAKINFGTATRQAYEKRYATSNSIEAAQKAVYEKATWLIRDYLGISGSLDVIH